MFIFKLLGILWILSINISAAVNLLTSPKTGSEINYIIDSKYSSANFSVHNLGIKITEKDLNNSVSFANTIINNMQRLETSLGWSNIKMKIGTPSHGMFISFSPEREAVKVGRDAWVALRASVQLLNSFCNKHDLNLNDCVKYLTTFKFTSTPLKASCTRVEKCSQEEYLSAYRSLDGSCNNILSGIMGKSFTGFTRLLYPDYLDGIHVPRRAMSKTPLPSARVVSMSVIDHANDRNDKLTLAVMQWGQFLEHDLSRPAVAVMVHTENPIECCSPKGKNLAPRYIHPFCSPISVAADDKYYSNKSVVCLNYVRSIPALRSDCKFGPTDQVNQATHFLDGSQIYGSTYRKSLSLRSFVDGKLETSWFNDNEYLPISQNPTEDCQVNSVLSCYKSGDNRVNFQPQLTAMHTIWFREHNRIAKELARLNNRWDDETLFQESRRILLAEIQHITYNEWIKTVLSRKYKNISENFSLYDQNVDPSVSNSFATAAMRALKSLYEGNIKLFDENRKVNHSLSLQKYFNNPEVINQPGVLDALVRGLATQNCERIDRHYAEDLINKLYANEHYGFDVFSIDIQRGRDHGLPSYTQYRTLCGLPKAEHFNDFSDVMSKKHISILSKTYSNPKDVDLIVGGILENLEENSIFGPTFSCIIADQFSRTKKGDRYFYSNENQPKPFSTSQLNEIRKITLARIFCDNGNNITMMQPNVFEGITISNKLTTCKGNTIPHLNLSLWAEVRGLYFN